jgi:hypothetical protein
MKKLSEEAIKEQGYERMFAGKLWAYTERHDGNVWALGIAIANEPGLMNIPTMHCHVSDFGEGQAIMSMHAQELNEKRGITRDMMEKIVRSAVTATNRKRRDDEFASHEVAAKQLVAFRTMLQNASPDEIVIGIKDRVLVHAASFVTGEGDPAGDSNVTCLLRDIKEGVAHAIDYHQDKMKAISTADAAETV